MKFSEIKYERFVVQNLITCYNSAKTVIENAKNVEEILSVRKGVVEVYSKLDTAFNLAYIRWSQNTANEFYNAEKRYYEENIPLVLESESGYINAILNSEFLDEIKGNIPEILLEIYQSKLIANNPKITKDIIIENLESSNYSNFISALTVDFNGENIPFTVLKKYMVDSDREVRKNAYNALGERLEKDAEFLNSNFNNLVKIRTKMAKKLGFDNFTKLGYYRMNRIGYTRNDISKFRDAVVKYIVPTVNRIKRKIYDKMLINEPKLYDNDVSVCGNVNPIFTGNNLFLKGADLYAEMSNETNEFFNFMINGELFDCLSRVNKWGGGYQTDLKDYNAPFIFANFNGSSQDVDVLTHEGGHAYASYLAFKNGVDKELGMPFMDVAETHSMSMEFFAYKYVDKFFGSNAKKYILQHFVDSFCFIPYGVMVDAFQELIYADYELTPENRNLVWKMLEKRFRPHLSSAGITYLEKGTRWQYQMHIYESPFYYIDYALAEVVALQFLFLSLDDYDLAFKKYNEFVSYGASMSFTDLINKVGLKSPFDENTIKEISLKATTLFDKLFTN
ncbi:MAG: M3 family oligoendopeptidase [Clostridia bacterium]|nr:M3 family oligoendopeptidase [Clostridia bacterium]